MIKAQIKNLLSTLNRWASVSSPRGLALLLGSAIVTITIMNANMRKHHPVRLRNGIGVSGMYLKAMARGIANAAVIIAAREVVRFQNIPKKNNAKAPGVR